MLTVRTALVAVALAGLAVGCGNTSGGQVVASPFVCPTRYPLALPHHQQRGTASHLVPGTPSGLTVCRYGPVPPGTSNQVVIRTATGDAAAVARTLNGLKPVPNGAVYNCPVDLFADDLLAFDSRDGRRLLVAVSLTGCTWASNGDRSAFTSLELDNQLAAIVGRP